MKHLVPTIMAFTMLVLCMASAGDIEEAKKVRVGVTHAPSTAVDRLVALKKVLLVSLSSLIHDC